MTINTPRGDTWRRPLESGDLMLVTWVNDATEPIVIDRLARA
jgi:hypothetical protein